MSNDEDFKIPELDWDHLENSLKQANKEIENNKIGVYIDERDEIRKRLSTFEINSSKVKPVIDIKNNYRLINTYMKNSDFKCLGQNLQICYMNEINDDIEDIKNNETKLYDQNKLKIDNVNIIQHNNPIDQFNWIHTKLQNETKLALSQVAIQVKLKSEKEKRSKKPSPLAGIVGFPEYGTQDLTAKDLNRMNFGQIQVIVNDLCNQIETINAELTNYLIERDELFIQQDAILEDIKDLTKRTYELTNDFKEKNNS